MKLNAFERWFIENFKEDPISGAQYLASLVMSGGEESVVWDYLDVIGDKNITRETFIKASKHILNKNKEE